MLPSIGYAGAAGTQTADRPPRPNATRNDSSSQEESFDREFASATGSREARPDREQGSKAVGHQGAGRPPVKKQPAAAQNIAKQSGRAATNTEATADAGKPVGAPEPDPTANIAAFEKRQPGKIAFAGPKRPEEDEKLPASPFAGPSAVGGGALLDASSLAMLLGAGTACAASATVDTAAASGAEPSTGEGAQPVTGIAPRTQESGATPGAGLAFALRLTHEPAAAPESDASSETSRGGANPNEFANALEAAADKAVAEVKTRAADTGASGAGPNFLQSASAQPAANAPVEAPAKATDTTSVAAPDPPSTANAPLRAVRVELASGDNQRVALTLVERGGALSVSVRSADSNLARSLQEHLPDLSARLTEQRYQTEVWAPRVELPAASTGSGASGHRNFESGGGKSGGQDGNSNSGQQQGRGGREAPGWFEELAAIGSKPQIRSEYLWVQ